jgi:hypothetical protein
MPVAGEMNYFVILCSRVGNGRSSQETKCSGKSVNSQRLNYVPFFVCVYVCVCMYVCKTLFAAHVKRKRDLRVLENRLIFGPKAGRNNRKIGKCA